MAILCLFIVDVNILLKYKYLYFYASLFVLLLSLWIGLLFSIGNINNNIVVSLNYDFFYMHLFYNEWYIDHISICFIILTTLLISITISLGLTTVKQYLKEYLIYFFILEFLLLNFFLTTNLMMFYIYFEAILIPMFLIIILWGSRKRKIHASYLFFFFTLLGSLFMLVAILWYFLYIGDLNMHIMQYLWISKKYQIILWLLFFIGFAVKIPIYPVHTWLPEAHVEAPTSGSIILAGILLKLGLYGMLRVLVLLFPIYNIYYTPLVLTLGFISTIYISLIILQQVDLKKIIAYSSIAHMNLAVIGLFVNNIYGIEGCIYTMLSHGLISTMLFFCIGVLYERYYERNILYYSNIVQIMPIFSFFFFIAIAANMGIPGLSSFVGEFLLLLSSAYKSIFLLIIISTSLLLATIYCIWLYNRISFGIMLFPFIRKFKDVTKIEFLILTIITTLILYFGIYPNCILNLLHDIIYFNIYKYLSFIKGNIYLNLKILFLERDDFYALSRKKKLSTLNQILNKKEKVIKNYDGMPNIPEKIWEDTYIDPYRYEDDSNWDYSNEFLNRKISPAEWEYIKLLRALTRKFNIINENVLAIKRKGTYYTEAIWASWIKVYNYYFIENPNSRVTQLIIRLCGGTLNIPDCTNAENEYLVLWKLQAIIWDELRYYEQIIRMTNSKEPK